MPRTATLAALLALSGAAALVYEIAWARQLAVLLGGTAEAAAAAVAAIFAGLALGGAAGARVAPRVARPLLGYAACEAAAAAWALAVPALIAAVDGPGLARALAGLPPVAGLAARAALAIALLLPATAALGATLPLIARATGAARATSWAYAANLLGAVAGVVVATFVLLRAVGVTATGQLGAAGSLVAAAIAVAIGRRRLDGDDADGDDAATAATAAPATPRPDRAPRWPVALAALSGAGTAAAQVLYTRALALTFHNSTYSFGVVVAAFLLALAIGAAIAAACARRDARAVAAVACALAGALIPASIALLWAITRMAYFTAPGGFAGYVAGALGLSLAVVGPPVVAMAIVLPTAWRAAGGPHARAVGRLTAINTIAAALATGGAAFALLPLAGLWTALAVVAAAYAAAALALAGRAGRVRALAVAAAVAVAIGAVAARPAPALRPGERMLARWETSYGWLEVVEAAGRRRMRLNVHYGLAATDQTVRQRRMGHLPLLLHPAPRRALFVGLATGITAGAATGHASLERIDVVELIPEIVRAARWFDAWNGGLLDDPRVRVHVGDARQWLRGARGAWDVVVTDLLVPWEAGAGALYAVEHHRAVAARLAPGGVYVQWIALWQVGDRELTRIADATAAVFPHVALWRGDTSRRWGVIAVVASDAPIALDGAALAARLDAIPPAVAIDDTWSSPAAIVSHYAGDWRRRAGAPLHTDDRPRLELEAPVTHRERTPLVGARLVRFYREVIAPAPRAAITYAPAPGEPPWDPAAGLALQMGAAGADGEPD